MAEVAATDDFDPLSKFPSTTKTPRLTQAEAIRRVYAAFQSGKRFVVLEAPTGSGKTHLAVNLARIYGKTWICTLTKSLQTQYSSEPDFRPFRLFELKGRAAYHCDRANDSCEYGGQVFRKDNACNPCEYKLARDAAMLASISVCNYHSFLAVVTQFEREFARRSLLVLDEVHELERVLMDAFSVEIRYGKLPLAPMEDPPDSNDIAEYWSWLERYEKELEAELEAGEASPRDSVAIERLLRSVSSALWGRQKEKFVLERDSDRMGFALRPVTAAAFASAFYSRAERVLLMSGTILDFRTFCRTAGIPMSEAAYVTVPCTFPAKNRPVVVGNLDMRMTAREQSWPKMVQALVKILDYHANEKGLLLTPSNAMLEYVQQRLATVMGRPDLAMRFVVAHGKNRDERLRFHLKSPQPTVLAASGMWEGVDLAEDASRFQIIPQLPRPQLSAQVRARMELDPAWYNYRTICRLIQGIGRSVRSDRDTAVTYILDGEFRRELARSNSLVPRWVKEAVMYSRGG